MGSGFRTFQSGEVLTSSNVQNYLMDQSVMVFAGTAARGSAIASPETGMVSYRTDGTADSKREGFEFYDGASWTRLVPATTTSGLELISSTTIGSAVASVTVSSAFSTTYDNYRIVLSAGTASTATGYNLTIGAAATAYYWAYSGRTFAGAASTGQGANSTSFASIANAGSNAQHMIIDVCSPFLSKVTVVTGMTVYADASAGYQYQYGGFLNNTTSYTAFTLTTQAGTMTGGTIQVFGYKN